MTGRKIEELAYQVLRELKTEGRMLATDHVRKREDGLWAIAFTRGKTRLEVSIDVESHRTDEAIKEEIRRQLAEQAPKTRKRPPSKRGG